ncbi:MAG: hypothetical protein HYZ74_08390, partial [Elusimicrobia bacterium]|nr:hypothetical protein [Elusimicrobiota bacterium]
SPSVIEPFLTIDPETLPKRMRAKIRAKQLEIRTLLKLHDTKKKGSILQPSEGCTQASFVKPTSELPGYAFAGYEEITESEERQLLERTLCNEVDLGCHFSLVIFYDAGSKVPRKLYMSTMDPLMALVAAARGGSKAGVGGNGYFGTGISCMH